MSATAGASGDAHVNVPVPEPLCKGAGIPAVIFSSAAPAVCTGNSEAVCEGRYRWFFVAGLPLVRFSQPPRARIYASTTIASPTRVSGNSTLHEAGVAKASYFSDTTVCAELHGVELDPLLLTNLAEEADEDCEDVNSASAETLRRVRGIGPAKARAIIAYREQHGPFGTLDDLARVRGIGPATVENFRRAGFCVLGATSSTRRSDNLPVVAGGSSAAPNTNCVDINTANAAALERVSGIGPAKARAILEFRETHGAFQSLDALVNVRGIGPATLENFREAGFCAGASRAGYETLGFSPSPPASQPDSPPVPYDRSLYGDWGDDDGDCQDTRAEVLIAESLVEVGLDATGCKVVSGKWLDPYTGSVFTDPGELDVDHFIPLAEVHRSGAAAWNNARRHAFANNLRQSGALIAVSSAANRSKGDRDPAGWLPPNEAYRCKYVEDWVAYKAAWQLTMDAGESQAVAEILSECLTDAEAPVSPAPGEVDAYTSMQPSQCTDINAADATTLRSVEGMSARRVNRLLNHIRDNGPIKALTEITAIRGIDLDILDSLRSAGFCEISGRASM